MQIALSRIILFGQNIAKLKDFYIENFGLSLVEEIKDEWVVLKAGQMEIAFHKIGAAYQSAGEFKAESNTKLVFKIETELAALRKRLISDGVLLGEIKSFPGIDALFCDGEDPEGNVFQLEQQTVK
jgi:predicted enzyme related to lactoylglutathione lyase